MNKIIKLFLLILLILFIFLLGWWSREQVNQNKLLSPMAEKIVNIKPKPLEQYTFDNLQATQFTSNQISLGETLLEDEQYTSYLFSFKTSNKKVTGQANIPQGKGPFPVIVMLRGWVDPAIYETGTGTKNAAKVFAQNGYLTLAPDFLGYGKSDLESVDVFEARLQKTTTVLDLLASIDTFPQVNSEKIGIWGHSNGGQIALAVLEITGKSYPTTLWAPVSKPFPYNILYYTDEFEDYGKALRKSLAAFEQDYDANLYSIHNYYDWITAPLQIHQGTADDSVPFEWNQELADSLEELEKEATFYQYSGADHDLRPSWNLVVVRDLNFFINNLK